MSLSDKVVFNDLQVLETCLVVIEYTLSLSLDASVTCARLKLDFLELDCGVSSVGLNTGLWLVSKYWSLAGV